jgi:hypothetical protein
LTPAITKNAPSRSVEIKQKRRKKHKKEQAEFKQFFGSFEKVFFCVRLFRRHCKKLQVIPILCVSAPDNSSRVPHFLPVKVNYVICGTDTVVGIAL